MSMSAFVTDLILIVIFFATVYRASKRGFVDAIAGLLSVIGAYFCAVSLRFVLDGVLQRYVFDPFVYSAVGDVLRGAMEGVETSLESAASGLLTAVGELIAMGSTFGLTYTLDAESALASITEAADLSAVTETLTADIAAPISQRLSETAAFLLLFVIAFLVLRTIFRVLNLIMRLPVLHEANRLLGTVCGCLLGGAYVYLAAQLMALLLGILIANGTLPPDTEGGILFRMICGGGGA